VSSEGVALISRVALVGFLILATAVIRTWAGHDRRRGLYVLFGTLGGIAAGIAMASVISRWIKTDASVILACLGISSGWVVAWLVARRIPRDAN